MATGATTDDGFHEIQLNGKQLVFLFMAVVVVSVVIFLCGVLVGRGVRPEAAATDALTSAAPAAEVPAPPPVVATPPSGAPATATEVLSYPNRLAGNEPQSEKLRADNRAAPPAPAPSATAPVTSPPPAPPSTDKAPSRAAAEPTAASSEPAGAGFAIQVAALRRRAEAEGVARGLSAKGYPAYVMSPDTGAPAVFRVRVGKFQDRNQAESIAARLEKEEQLKPWIVR